jgi:hypothetical protein
MKNRASPRILMCLVLGITCAVLVGCGFSKSKKDAEKVLARHFQAIATNGFETAIADYGEQFFQKHTKDEWKNTLVRLTAKLGTYQSNSIANWRVFKKAGSLGAGTTVEMVCQSVYSKYPAEERFVFFKGVLDSDYKIVGHYIGSDGWLKE